MKLKIVLLSLLFLLPVLNYTEEEGILVLNNDDLHNITTLFPQIFIKYYVPWCRHCQQLAPVYKEIAKELQRMNSTVRLAKIDCEENEKAYEFQNIQHFPTLVFYNKGEPTDFDGDRTKGYILKWLTKRLVFPVKEITVNEYEALKGSQSEEVALVFHGALESVKGATFTNIAYQDNYNSYYFIKDELKTLGTVDLFRSFADDVDFPYPNDDFPQWISEHDRPAVVPLDDRSISSLFRDSKVGVLLFLESQFSERKVQFSAAAEFWRNKKETANLIFVDVPEEHEDYFGLLEYMDVNPRETPVVIVDSEAQKKYLLKVTAQEMKREKIIAFLNDFAEGKVASSPLESQHAHHHHDHDHQHDHNHHHHHHDHQHHHHHQHDHEHHDHEHHHDHQHDEHDHDHSNCGHDHSHQHSHQHTSQPTPTQHAESQQIPQQPLPEAKTQQERPTPQVVSIQL